jgi:hypothetical protein
VMFVATASARVMSYGPSEGLCPPQDDKRGEWDDKRGEWRGCGSRVRDVLFDGIGAAYRRTVPRRAYALLRMTSEVDGMTSEVNGMTSEVDGMTSEVNGADTGHG